MFYYFTRYINIFLIKRKRNKIIKSESFCACGSLTRVGAVLEAERERSGEAEHDGGPHHVAFQPAVRHGPLAVVVVQRQAAVAAGVAAAQTPDEQRAGREDRL